MIHEKDLVGINLIYAARAFLAARVELAEMI